MKKIKLIKGLSMGAIIATTPLVALTSCGGLFAKRTNQATTIRFGMRAEDFASWKPVIKAFEDKYQSLHDQDSTIPAFKIKEVILSDQKAQYSMNDIPTITSIDPNTADTARKPKNNWFMKLDPYEFLGTKNNDKYKLFPDQTGIKFKSENNGSSEFFEPAFQPYNIGNSTNNHPQLVGVPYQYGPGMLYINKGLIDQTRNIHIYIPDVDPSATKPIDAVDTGIKATLDNIKMFVLQSGNKKNKFKDLTSLPAGANLMPGVNHKILKYWSGYGAGNMYQRIASLAVSTIDKTKNVEAGWSKDIGFPFEIAATATKDIFKNGQIDDSKLKSEYKRNGELGTPNNYFEDGRPISNTFGYLYTNYLGYFKNQTNSGGAVDPAAAGQPGEAELMWKQKAAYLLGKKWSGPLIRKNWVDKSTDPNTQLVQLPIPYGSANMDGLGIAKNTTGQKLIASKQFIKLALSKHKTKSGVPFSYLISRDIQNQPTNILAYKAVPTSNYASQYVKDLAKKKFGTDIYKYNQFLAPFDMGKNDLLANSDALNGVAGFFAASSTEGIYQIFNDNITVPLENWQKSNSGYLKSQTAYTKIQEGITETWSEIDNA